MKTSKTILTVLLGVILQILQISGNDGSFLERWGDAITNQIPENLSTTNQIYIDLKAEQLTLAELRRIVEETLTTFYSTLLIHAIGSEEVIPADTKIKKLYENIRVNKAYGKPLSDGIFSATINGAVSKYSVVILPEFIWNFNQRPDPQLYDLSVRLLLQLYNSVSIMHIPSMKQFIERFSYILYKSVRDDLYDSLEEMLLSRVYALIELLPNNLKHVYFRRHFCMSNVYYGTFMYSSLSYHQPLLWNDNKDMDNKAYIRSEFREYNVSGWMIPKLLLKSALYGTYYTLKKEPLTWGIVFLDGDHVCLHQSELIMCASEFMRDANNRFVVGTEHPSLDNPECQWRLGSCDFN